MKLITSITALLAGLTLTAQDYDFTIVIARNQSVTTAFALSTTHINFNSFGSHYADGGDATVFVADSSVARPYTRDSSSNNLMSVDSRPHLRATMRVPFGVFSNSTNEFYIQGAWGNPGTSNLFDVQLIENASGVAYNMYNENSFTLNDDVAFNNQFTIVFTPRANLVATNESCFGQIDGSIYAQSPQPNWQLEMYLGATLLNTFSVTGTDTLIANQSAGNYTFIYKMNNLPVDTSNASINGPAQITASCNLSNNMPQVNEVVTFTNTSTGAMDYAWDFGDGNTSIAVSPTHTYTVAGTYTVTLIAYNVTGCSNTITYVVTVGAPSIQGPPTNLSNRNENGNEMARVLTTVQSQNNNAALSTTGDATISQFSVYSANGQLLFRGSGAEKTFTYDTPGIYLIQIQYTNDTIESKQWYLN